MMSVQSLDLGDTGEIGVVEFGNARELDLLGAALAVERLPVAKAAVGENVLGDFALFDLFEEIRRQLERGTKGLFGRRQKILGLAVKGRVLNEAIDKDGEVVDDERLFDFRAAALVFLFERLDQMARHLVGEVIDVRAALVRGNAVDKGDLRRHRVETGRHGHLPTAVVAGVRHGLFHRGDAADVVLEGFDGQFFAVQPDLDALAAAAESAHGAGNVVGALGKERHRVVVEVVHAEFLQVGRKGDLDKVAGLEFFR